MGGAAILLSVLNDGPAGPPGGSAGAPDAKTVPALVTERRQWQERMSAVGPERAYDEFKARYAGQDFQLQHTRSHLFGGLLYPAAGINGIAVCDPLFGDFGCEHGFSAAAITAGGLDAVAALNTACTYTLKGPKLIVSCQHGIGHGILEYLGRDRLPEALEACPAPPPENPFAGCAVGVFMEYNVPTAHATAPADAGLRVFDPDRPYVPCPSLPDAFRLACYHQLPQWWEKVMAKDYRRIGQLCADIPATAARDACFRGAGNVAGPSSRYDVAATVRKCRSMPSAHGRALCLQTASWGFDSVPAYRRLAPKLCAELDDALRPGCAPATPEDSPYL